MPARLYVRLIQLSILYSGIFACAGDSPLAPLTPPTVVQLDVSPPTPAVVRGSDLQLTVTPKAAGGESLGDRPVAFTSITPTVASVTAAGVVRGLAQGVATIRVSSETVVRDVNITVLAAPLAGIVTSVAVDTLDEGGTTPLRASVVNTFGETVPEATVTWTSLSPIVATVDDGLVNALSEGTATIRVTHGDLSAVVLITVQPVFGGDLLFASPDGPFGASRLYRTDGVDYASVQPVVDLNGFAQPAVSPDGQRLAFVCPGSGPAICVANIDGSDIKMLTSEESTYEDQPSWSPDGSQIAFRRYSAVGGQGPWNPSDIWVMDADGSDPVNLTDDATSQHWPAWSPPGTTGPAEIAFVQDSLVDGYQTSRIAVMSATGTERRALTAFAMSVVTRPRWAPDGATLLFARTGDGLSAVMRLVTVATGVERGLLAEPLQSAGETHPTFSPNGRYVVFSSAHEDVGGVIAAQIYTVRADGSDVRRRSTGAVDKREFAWRATP